MDVRFILAISILLQFTAAGLALYLIRLTGRYRAWMLIALAVLLMAIRRSVTFYDLLTGASADTLDTTAEVIALAISVLMVAGLASIGPMLAASGHARQRAHQQVQFQSRLLDAVEQIIVVAAPDGTVTYWNKAAEHILGWSADDIVGRNLIDETAAHGTEQQAAAVIEQVRQGQGWRGELMLRRKNGETFPVLATGSPVHNEAGDLVGFIGVAQDISARKAVEQALEDARATLEQRVAERTADLEAANAQLQQQIAEREQAEAALRKSQRRYELASRAGEVGVWDWNLQTDDIYLDPNLKAMLGYADHEIKNHISDWITHVHPDDVAGVTVATDTALNSGSDHYEAIHRMLHKAGGDVWFLARGRVLRDESGQAYRIVGTDTNVTARKQVEDALRDSETKFRQIAETIRESFWISDVAVTETIYVSPAHEEIWGISPDEMYDDPAAWMALIHPEDRPQVEAAIEAQARGEITHLEYRIIRADGEQRWVQERAFPIRDAAGEVYRVAGATEDITARKVAQDALRASEERFRQIADNIREAFWMTDPAITETLYVSPAYERIWSIPAAELYQHPQAWMDLIHPDDQARVQATIDAQIVGENTQVEYRIIRRDGELRWVRDSAFPIRNDADEVYRVAGVSEDITERKQAEDALRDSEDKFRSVIEQFLGGIVLMDRQGQAFEWNQGMERITGIPHEEVIGQPFWEVQLGFGPDPDPSPEDRQRAKQRIDDFLATGDAPWLNRPLEHKLRRPDGSRRIIESVVFPIHREQGVMLGSVLRDVTEQREAEAAARASDAHLRTMAANAPVIMFTIDREGIFTLSEGKALAKLGRLPGEVVGQSVYDVHANNPDVIANIERALSGAEFTATVEVMGIILETYYTYLEDEQGAITGALGVAADVTERYRAQRDLQAQQTFLRQIIDANPNLIFVKDTEGRYVLANRAMAERHNITPQAMLGKTDADINPKRAEVDEYTAQDRKILEPNQPRIQQEDSIIHPKTGETRWYHGIKGPLVLDDSSTTYILGVATDITERKQAEEALRKSEAEKRAILDAIPDLLFQLDCDGTCQAIYAEDEALLAVPPDEVIGKKLGDVLPPHIADGARRSMQLALKTGQPHSFEYQLELPIGTHYFEARHVPSDPEGVLAIVRDITDRRRAEQHALDLALERERSRIMSSFIRDISHEFANPVSVINTSLYLLQQKVQDAPEEQRHKHLATIDEQIKHIKRLVEGMLTMTQLDSGIEFERKPLDLNQILHQLQYMIGHELDDKDLTLVYDLDQTLPTVPGDAQYLIRALRHLLENAAQYTPAGTITLRTRVQGNWAVIDIEDTGIGIAADDQEQVFKRFYRVDEARSSRGVGLGLPMARTIIEQHRGHITVTSAPGEGSTFTVFLPLADN